MAASVKTYTDLQSNLDKIYKQSWVQPNAFVPITFGYTIPTNKTGGEIEQDTKLLALLKNAVNEGPEVSTDAKLDSPTNISLDEYVEKENEIAITNLNTLCPYLVNITGLSTPKVPLSKKNGRMVGGEFTDKSSVKLKFLCPADLSILPALHAWQSHWMSYDFQKRSLASKRTSDVSLNTKAGEGYLGVDYINIARNGTTTRCTHLSIFGLIPIGITPGFMNDIGPQANVNGLSTVEVDCVYSVAYLVIPVTVESKETTKYFYFD